MHKQPAPQKDLPPTLGYNLCGAGFLLAGFGTALGLGGLLTIPGMALLFVGPFVWAREKGYSLLVALLLGALHFVGWVIVWYLPDERESPSSRENPLYPGH